MSTSKKNVKSELLFMLQEKSWSDRMNFSNM